MEKITNFVKLILYIVLIVLFGKFAFVLFNSTELSNQTVKQEIKVSIPKIIEYVASISSDNRVNKSKVEIQDIKAKTNTDIYYKNLNELLVSQNPTIVKLMNVEKTKWVGDKEAFYTLIFKNKTPLNANKFKVKVNNDKVKFKHSNTATVFYSENLSLKGNKSFHYPLVSVSELAKHFKIKKEKILGMGITPNIPNEISKKAIVKTKYGTSSNVNATPLFIEYSYETIFKQKRTNGQAIYIYINSN